MTPYNRPSKELQELWYKKLEDAGFRDVETPAGYFKQESISGILDVSSKMRYFQLAGQFLYEYKFKSKFERIVWVKHASGLSFREMTTELKAEGFKTANKDGINAIVKRLSKEMLARFNNEEDMYE